MKAVSLIACVVLAMLAAGCQSAIVGAECRAPLVRCGHYCVDLATDGLNCGECGNACIGACASSRCVTSDAAVIPDGGRDAGRHDAGRDAGSDTSVELDGGRDAFVAPDASVDANVDGGGVRCGLGERLCSGVCIDPRDDDHCGDCATSCTSAEVCAAGTCAASCGTLSACGTRCVDFTSDPHHCGDCTTDCGTDACVASACVASDDGHLVVIGHDYETRRVQMSIIVANAVFLAPRFPARVLAYEGRATALSITGTNAAITEAANTRTRVVTRLTDVDALPVMLESADTFLIYAQAGATDAELQGLGYAWGPALTTFLDRGGVIVSLEAPSLTNGGTFQILRTAGLFEATSVSEIVTPSLTAATGRASDPILMNVTFPYSGERHTVRISSLDPDAIVATGSSSVVFHHVIH